MEAVRNNEKFSKVERTRIVALEQGKLPPQAMDVERAILGAMLIDRNGLDDALMVLKSPDVFYKAAHKAIFEAMQALYNDTKPVDLITVSEWLKANGRLQDAGGDFYLIDLTQAISSSAHTEYHAYILLQYYIKRQIIRESSQFMALAYDDTADALQLVESWATAQDNIAQVAFNGKREKTYADGLREVREKIVFLTNKKPEEISGVSTGFANADRFTGGWQPQDLIIIAARPGMGKTSIALEGALANVKAGVPVGIISAEMSAYQCNARTVAQGTNFHLRQITKTGFEKAEYFGTLDTAIQRMEKYPLHIDDTAHPDISHVMSKARYWKRKYNIGLLIVDYLQLLKDVSVGNNREQEIASISRKLKGLAKELGIPVIALSQLSREVEKRGDKRPLLSDLRESGALEQDADAVLFIYRPQYYYSVGWEGHIDEDVLSDGGDTELIFAKYRGGAPNTVIGLKWIGDKTKYIDPAEWHKYENHKEQAHYEYRENPLPTPTASEAFDAPGYSIEDVSSDNDDMPF